MRDMKEHTTYSIPMDHSDTHSAVDAVVLTSAVQVGWIMQLVAFYRRLWALHIDGKHKLHHGGWLLVTVGTHVTEQRTYADNCKNKGKLVHAFRPLAYMFTKHHEDIPSVLFVYKSLELVARMCTPTHHEPRHSTHRYLAIRHDTYRYMHNTLDTLGIHTRYRFTSIPCNTPRYTPIHAQYTGYSRNTHAIPFGRYHKDPMSPTISKHSTTGDELHLEEAEPALVPLETHQQAIEDGGPRIMEPGVVCSDHARGIISASLAFYLNTPVMGCFAHVTWHFSHGKLLPKDHPKFDEIQLMLPELHTCHTDGMWDVLVFCIGRMWGDSDTRLNTLFGSILATPNNRWFIGAADCPAADPSQQSQARAEPHNYSRMQMNTPHYYVSIHTDTYRYIPIRIRY